MNARSTVLDSPLPDAPAKYLDMQGCSSRYGFSDRHWIRLVDAGKAPPPTRFGRLVRWNIASIEEWEAAGCPSYRKQKSTGSPECELCGDRPAEHFADTPWGERHICTQCAESLPENN
jgi:predicted DNA-binding transcriptional regulator AlpA